MHYNMIFEHIAKELYWETGTVPLYRKEVSVLQTPASTNRAVMYKCINVYASLTMWPVAHS